jgi:hypothetical protein
LVFSINFLFSSNSLATISSTAFLKAVLSIVQNPHISLALTEAERGAPYNKANSPKQSPYFKTFFTLLLIIISHSPFSKK